MSFKHSLKQAGASVRRAADAAVASPEFAAARQNLGEVLGQARQGAGELLGKIRSRPTDNIIEGEVIATEYHD